MEEKEFRQKFDEDLEDNYEDELIVDILRVVLYLGVGFVSVVFVAVLTKIFA